jgi:hypothetical protein
MDENYLDNMPEPPPDRTGGTVAEQRPRYAVRDAAFALQPRPALDWLIEKLVSRGSVSVFYGEGGSKKTYSMLSLAVCAARGNNWLNFQTKPCRVLIIDEESGEERLSLRLAATLRGAFAGENTPIEFVSLGGFKLDNKNDELVLLQEIIARKIELVIIDALADVMSGDENSKQETQPVFNALRRLAEKTHAAIIVIHHSNKVGGYRGSTVIKNSCDLLINVKSEEQSAFVNFKSEKNRDGEPITWTARATWTEDQFYLEATENLERVKALNKSQAYVIRYLTEHGASPLTDIMTAADSCSPNAAKMAVYALVDIGKIQRTNQGEKGAAAIYDLVKESNDECD